MQSPRMRLIGGLVLWITVGGLMGCQGNRLKQERDALWVQNQELQQELDRTRAALDAAEADRSSLLTQLERQPAPAAPAASANTAFSGIAGVESFQSATAVTVRVPGDVLFESGKADLKASAKQTLAQIAAVIQREYPDNTIRVEGYTDTDPIRRSGWKDNLELSLQRAASVHRYLQQQGISADRMYAAGFGESRPRQTKAQSRRVEIVVVLQE